jgi:ATP-dependent Clp protease ATP-binding subunit ClpA
MDNDVPVRDPVSALTSRMRKALVAAEQTAGELGHHHIGCEHVFLAILLDRHSIPSQILQQSGTLEEIVQRLQALLAGELYNRGIDLRGGARDEHGGNRADGEH